MIFEWDEAKRQENFRRRGVDFVLAAVVFEDPDRIEIPDDRRDYGEARTMVLGRAEGQNYLFVYTLRGEARRIITAWKVGQDGRRRYEALQQRRAQADD